MEIKTRDIWQSAYILSKGIRLEDIRPSDKSDKLVTFVFKKTPEVYRLKREFMQGKAECNVSRLRASMLHLKQEVISIIRR
jgi:hypothetical protein